MNRRETLFSLINDLLTTGFSIDSFCMDKLSDNVSQMDRGLRQMMWGDYPKPDVSSSFETNYGDSNAAVLIRSNLGFYNLIYYIHDDSDSYCITVGPFRGEDASIEYFESIMREAHISRDQMLRSSAVFRTLPLANPGNINSICHRLISELYPGFSDVKLQFIEFSDEHHEFTPDNDNITQYTNDFFDIHGNHLKSVLAAIQTGNVEEGRKMVASYMNHMMLYVGENQSAFPSLKRRVQSLNSMAAHAVLMTSVHPTHVFKLENQLMASIDSISSFSRMTYLPYDICHKYCLLVKNYGNSGYSKLIRQVIEYIDFHLDEDITLSAIAEKFNRNASTLSNQFHLETGTKLTEYVKQARVREAISLFNSTNLSVSEVSIAVGYADFAYFSRVFKQIKGITPREYKKMQVY